VNSRDHLGDAIERLLMITHRTLLALLLPLLVQVLMIQASDASESDTSRIPYQVVPAKPGERCTVCGGELTQEDVALIVRGRRVPLDIDEVDEFLKNQEMYFAKLQPKGALFQEELDTPEGTAQGGVSAGWFWFGVYVLSALVFGALSSYTAITKGLQPIPHFFLGFFLSLLGYLYVLTRPRRVHEGEVPPGLVKVPVTSAPVKCPSCGNTNHPTATRCAACHATLTPVAESEASKALH